MAASKFRDQTALTDRLIEARHEQPIATRARQLRTLGRGLVVVVAILLLCWSRLANLGTSFWNDEAYTALTYGDAGPRAIFRGELYVPNNHVLFSVLSWATARVFGDFEAAYRIWSVLPALVAVVLVAWWARRFFDSVTSVAVVVLATVSGVHLVLAPQARGYGLAMLAGATMLIGALRADQLRRRDGVVLFALSGLVGICTLPVFALGFISQAAILCLRRELRRSAVWACALVGLASAIFYAPLVRAILDASDQKVGEQLPWSGFLTGPYRHLGKPNIAAIVPEWSAEDAIVLVVTGVLAGFAVVRLLRRDSTLLLHLLVPVAGTYVALTTTRFYVEPRFASFLLFHAIVLLAVGVSALWNAASRSPVLQGLTVAVAVMAFLVGGRHVVEETRLQASQPWENFKAVGDVATSTDIHRVFSNSSTHAVSLRYYTRNDQLTTLGPGALRWQLYCTFPAPFIFVIHHGWGNIEPDVGCLRQRGAVKMRLAQQIDPPIGGRGPIDVWVVSSDTPSAPASLSAHQGLSDDTAQRPSHSVPESSR
jgi:hypothetical protein